MVFILKSQGRTLDQILKTNLKNDEVNQQQAQAQAHRHQMPKQSSFNDIKDALSEIEKSKEKFEESINALWRNRDNNFNYVLNGNNTKDK